MATVAGILDWVAKTCWQETHDDAECPPDGIPTEEELADWLKVCPSGARYEAQSLLLQVTKMDAAWWEAPIEQTPVLLAMLAEEVVFQSDPLLEIPKKDYAFTTATPNEIHQMWLQHRENNKNQQHPLAPLVKAWQKRPVLVQPNQRNDPLLPVIRSVEVSVSLEREAAQLMLGLVPDSPEERPMPLFPDVPKLSDQARRVPLLALADASGTPSMAQGRGAALDLRLVVETTLSVDPADRMLPTLALPFTVKELRNALFPNGWREKRDWPRVRDALLRAHTRSIPIDERGSQWFPLAIRQLPSETSMRLDDQIIIEVALPPGSKTGPIINRRELRQLGVQSSPKYRAYIGVHSLAWALGVTRVVNPRTKKRGWAANPDAYPVLTVHDRRVIAFGAGDNKNRTIAEIDAPFTNLPGTALIDENAIDRKTGVRGWRVIPTEAANAVQARMDIKAKKLPNRGKSKS